MMPIVNGLEEEFSGQLTVLQLNAAETENAQLMQEYGLRGHPSFAILGEDGRLLETYFGPQTEESLRNAILNILP
jgi:thioredoxin-like negative regulator of GroEL